ncbi:hypothetical protein HYV74_00320 [Candidatus Uhrbacteria bacterium]|nr:hypothetical protein [Candidatus Uhrbacteria bacterium]
MQRISREIAADQALFGVLVGSAGKFLIDNEGDVVAVGSVKAPSFCIGDDCKSSWAAVATGSPVVQLQSATPGTAQDGHLNISGTIRGTQLCLGGECKTTWSEIAGTSVSLQGSYPGTADAGNFHVSGSGRVGTDLAVIGTTTLGAAGGSSTVLNAVGSNFYLNGEGNIQLRVGTAGAATTEKFSLNNGANAEIFSLDETGALDVAGGIVAGTGNVQIVNATGKINNISSTTFANLSGSNLTTLNATQLTTGTVNAARLPSTMTQATTFTGVPTGTGVLQGSLIANPASATANYALLGVAAAGDVAAAGRLCIGSDCRSAWPAGILLQDSLPGTAQTGNFHITGGAVLDGALSSATLNVAGGITAGSGSVGIIDSTGKIPELSSTYLANLSGANLTSLNAANLTGDAAADQALFGVLVGSAGKFLIDNEGDVVAVGSVKAPSLCMGDDCKSRWSDVTAGTVLLSSTRPGSQQDGHINITGDVRSGALITTEYIASLGPIGWGPIGGPAGSLQWNESTVQMGAYSNNDVHIITGGDQPRVQIQHATGNVGIGSAPSPDYRLNVGGTLNATRICINGDCQTAWPAGGAVGNFVPLRASAPTTADAGHFYISGSGRIGDALQVDSTGATALDVAGGIVAGTGNIQIVNAAGKIPVLSATTLANLTGSNLTNLNASQLAAGTVNAARLPSTMTQATTFTGVPTGTGVLQGSLIANPASATANYALLGCRSAWPAAGVPSVALLDALPGTAQTGHFNISGSGVFGNAASARQIIASGTAGFGRLTYNETTGKVQLQDSSYANDGSDGLTLDGSNLHVVGALSATSLDIAGGIQAGSGNVAIIDGSGKIPGISSTYFTSLSGANLTELNASNISTGAINIARIPNTVAKLAFPAKFTGSASAAWDYATLVANPAYADEDDALIAAGMGTSASSNAVFRVDKEGDVTAASSLSAPMVQGTRLCISDSCIDGWSEIPGGGGGGGGSFVPLRASAPSTADTGHFYISGSGRIGSTLQVNSTAASALDVGGGINAGTGNVGIIDASGKIPAISSTYFASTALNASDLSSGTVAAARLPSTVILEGESGSTLTNLNASNLASGTVSAARLPTSITQATTFTALPGGDTWSGFTPSVAINPRSDITNSGWPLLRVGMNDAAIFTVLGSGSVSVSGGIFAGTSSGTGVQIVNGSGKIPEISSTYFSSVSGANLTNLNAANLTGTIDAARLPTLTNLNASNLASGTVSAARLPTSITQATTFAATPSGAGVLQGALAVNPASAGSDRILFGVAVNGVSKLKVDAEGDVEAASSLKAPSLCLGSDCRTSWPSGGSSNAVSLQSGGLTAQTGGLSVTGEGRFGSISVDDLVVSNSFSAPTIETDGEFFWKGGPLISGTREVVNSEPSTTGSAMARCQSGYLLTGGGCMCNGPLKATWPSSDVAEAWQCVGTCSRITAYAICLKKTQ